MQMCDECGTNPANVHVTQIAPDKTVVLHLCEECARRRGLAVGIDTQAPPKGQASKVDEKAETPCPRCGLTFIQFREQGRLGCPACYESFGEEIDRMLSEMHGSCEHKGKQYHRARAARATNHELARLRADLADAIREEKFEEAARLRDTLKSLDHGPTSGAGT